MNYDGEYGDADKAFDDAEIHDGFRDVPSGTYQAYVDRVDWDQPDYADFQQLRLTCKILSGEYAGSCVFPNGNINPQYIHYLKGMLSKMGLDPIPRPSEIQARLDDMLNRVLEVYVAPKKEGSKYANCYVNCFIKMLDNQNDGPPPLTDADDPTGRW